jgi:hypothetical protein
LVEAALLLLLAVVGSLIVADTVFTLMPIYADYAVSRIGFEYLVSEVRLLGTRDKRSERRRRKLLPKLEETRRRLSRYSLLRLLLVLPLYIATAYISLTRPLVLPIPCCIPVLAHVAEVACFTTAPIFVALAYVMFLPLLQESLALMLMLKRGWIEAVARRLERW